VNDQKKQYRTEIFVMKSAGADALTSSAYLSALQHQLHAAVCFCFSLYACGYL